MCWLWGSSLCGAACPRCAAHQRAPRKRRGGRNPPLAPTWPQTQNMFNWLVHRQEMLPRPAGRQGYARGCAAVPSSKNPKRSQLPEHNVSDAPVIDRIAGDEAVSPLGRGATESLARRRDHGVGDLAVAVARRGNVTSKPLVAAPAGCVEQRLPSSGRSDRNDARTR